MLKLNMYIIIVSQLYLHICYGSSKKFLAKGHTSISI